MGKEKAVASDSGMGQLVHELLKADIYKRSQGRIVRQMTCLAIWAAFALAAYQAAMDGLGVALGRNALVAPDLKAGRLVVPFEFKMSADAAYYLVYPPEAIRRRKIKAFRDWILSLAEVQQGQLPPRAA